MVCLRVKCLLCVGTKIAWMLIISYFPKLVEISQSSTNLIDIQFPEGGHFQDITNTTEEFSTSP